MVFKHKKINYAKPNPKTSRLFYHSGLREAWGLGGREGSPVLDSGSLTEAAPGPRLWPSSPEREVPTREGDYLSGQLEKQCVGRCTGGRVEISSSQS